MSFLHTINTLNSIIKVLSHECLPIKKYIISLALMSSLEMIVRQYFRWNFPLNTDQLASLIQQVSLIILFQAVHRLGLTTCIII